MSKKENKIKKGNSFNAFYRNQYGISAAKLINIPAIIGVPIFIIQLIGGALVAIISIPIYYITKYFYIYICRNNIYIFGILCIILMGFIVIYAVDITIFFNKSFNSF